MRQTQSLKNTSKLIHVPNMLQNINLLYTYVFNIYLYA